MVTYIKDDIFLYKKDIIVNPVNNRGVSGAGLAKAFKHRYPENQLYYETSCKNNELKAGDILVFQQPKGPLVINAVTKNDWKDPSEYWWIDMCLIKIYDLLSNSKGKITLLMPFLGCGCGGLDKKLVKKSIETYLGGLDIDIKVFEL